MKVEIDRKKISRHQANKHYNLISKRNNYQKAVEQFIFEQIHLDILMNKNCSNINARQLWLYGIYNTFR
jgi:hypothetical protein